MAQSTIYIIAEDGKRGGGRDGSDKINGRERNDRDYKNI